MKKIAVIIPSHNEEKYIAKCLDSIVACNYNKEYLKVFVCDGLSTDNTVDIIKQYTRKYSYITCLINEKKTTQFALNIGIRAGNADVKIILGAHAEIYPDYIDQCVEAFAINNQIGCVGGLLENINEDEASNIIAMAMSSGFGVGNAYFRTGESDGYVDTVAFGAYKKEVFDNIGLFDEDLVRNQDDEFNFRLIKAGYKIYLSKKIKAKYYVRASFRKLFKQYYQYGYWKVYVNTKHKTITTIRQLVPFFFVLYLTAGIFLSFFSLLFFEIFLIILLFYFFIGCFYALKKTKLFIEIIKIEFSFFVLHLSYGYGYMEGIMDFLFLRKKPSTRKKEISR